MPSYTQLLEQLSREVCKYGGGLQPPCNPEALEDLQRRARELLGSDLPQGYAEFLRRHDGLDWDGLVFYASRTVPITGHEDRSIEGFIDSNLGFRENERMKQFLVFGDSGMDIYVYDQSRMEYGARDRISLDINESYASFEEMLTAALIPRL